MTTQFTDPAPPAGPQFADPAPPEAPGKRLFDGFGRYLLPDPDTGKERAWTRVTTLAKTLEDTYNLEQWGARMAVKGMAMRPDLVAMAATLNPNDDDDKKTLNRLAKDAKEAAGSSAGANMGTALHKLTERVDGGEKVDAGPMSRELDAYRATLAREGLKVRPDYLERIICVPELGVAGRLDKLLEVPGLPFQVADLKSQKSMDFGGLGIAVQQAIYAHAYAIWDPVAGRWEDPPELDQVLATIIWLPVGRGICELFDVDLCLGWEWAQLSARVRGIRKAKPVTRRESMVPVSAMSVVMPSPVSETISESGINGTNFPANAASQAEMVAPSTEGATVGGPSGTWRGPDHQVPEGTTPEMDPADPLDDELASIMSTISRFPRPWGAPSDPYEEDVRARALELWEEKMRRAATADELLALGRKAMSAYGGQLPDSLKALGRELRAKLTEHAPAA
ncbi:hypothetical protein ACIBI0_38690 [Microbispora rosea]|uniref:hypothetical protein n=1 Tax=Microbispora rosea TaxID=58117 RepID=UPI00378E020C